MGEMGGDEKDRGQANYCSKDDGGCCGQISFPLLHSSDIVRVGPPKRLQKVHIGMSHSCSRAAEEEPVLQSARSHVADTCRH